MYMLSFGYKIVNEYNMIVEYFKSWIRENENKIDNLFLHSFKCPMKITEMYKDIDANGTGQNYQNLKKFLNSSFSDKDLNKIEVQIDTSEDEGIILFSFEYPNNESYFYSLGKNQVKKFSKDKFFKYLDDGLKEALKKDNWSETFGHRYITMLSKDQLGFLYPNEKDIWEKRVRPNFKKDYQKFQSQPIEWNQGITKLLDLLLNDELTKIETYETLADITHERFDKIKFKSFICEAPEIEKRITGQRKEDIIDICLYIYAIIEVPDDDSLDSLTRQNINDWLMNNIKLIDINWIMEFLQSFPFNKILYNYCVSTTEVIGVDKKDFNDNIYYNFPNKNKFKITDDASISKNKLQKTDFIDVLNKTENKLTFNARFEYFEDLPQEFVLKCNLLACALINKLSENKLRYDYKLIKPETYLLDLCEDFTQYLSLVKSIKANFDIIDEVPEKYLISMKDVYYYIYLNLED